MLPQISELPESVLGERGVSVSLGDLEKDATQGVLVELNAQSRAAGTFRLAQVDVTYDVPSAALTGQKAQTRMPTQAARSKTSTQARFRKSITG